MIDLEWLLRLPCVDPEQGFSISPDGLKAAFSWNKTGQWEIYEVLLDGSAIPQQVTQGPGGKFAPRYSPDGTYLAYVVDFDGGERFSLITRHLSSSQITNLTQDEPGALQPSYSWSPDSAWLAFISDRSGVFDTYIMPASGGTARLVLSISHPQVGVRWSPDSRWLLITAETHGQDYGVFIAPVEGGEIQHLSDQSGALNARSAYWSPDSRQVAFASDIHGFYDIGIYDLENRDLTWVTSGKGDKSFPHWSPDGRWLVYVHSQGEITWLELFDRHTRKFCRIQAGAGVHYLPKFTPDGKAVAFVFDNPCMPDDLWLYSIADGSLRQLTHSLPSDAPTSLFTMPTAVEYPGMDGEKVPALLFQPPQGGSRPPGVVIIHGGPTWLFQFLWYPIMQHMVSRGWVVLAPNYRGSSGYGRSWQLANRFDLGGVDTQDVVAGADYLIRQGLVDPRRIAVTGRSHGGYLTMTCLTQFPDRWASGSAVVPFLNWFTSHANSREDLQHWDIENFGDPQENHDLWHTRSPFFFLDRLQAPVQLICGANDPRCPASESLAAQEALQALGKPVDLILYPDEGHAFLKIENVIDSELRRLAFLAQVLEID
ncbi:MAG: S9 family peptidase [Anaerolineales bacterium]|nr:S9 family peptidase [Anaerolineales bacterium]